MIHALLAVTVTVTTIAGVPGVAGRLDGAANIALFNKPTHLTVDLASGDVYVVDRMNSVVRKVSGGAVSTFHLDSSLPESFDFGGPMSGGIVIEPPGQYPTSPFYGRGLFIASTGAHVLEQRDIYGAPFVHDSVRVGVKNAPGEHDGTVDPTIPVFHGPTAVTVDRRRYPTASCCNPRSIFIADTGNGSIRKLIRVINFEAEYFAESVATFARGFVSPRGLAFGPDGSLFVTDSELHTVTRIAPDGLRTVVAGEPAVVGSDDGIPGLLRTPTGIDVDDAGNVYVADTGNGTIRRLRPDGVLETIAGVPGEGGYADGNGRVARFNGPVGLQIAPDGSLIVADTSNHVIRRITIASAPPGPRRRGVRH